MSELIGRPNIGVEIERQLKAVGINTYEELVAYGSRTAWLKIRAIDKSACVNRLMGLEGAIRNIRWHNLPAEVKEGLKEFYAKYK